MSKALNILMMLHMPWTRDLGAPRVSVELAEEFEALGHHVDKFDINDAVPNRTKLSSYFELALFSRRAVRYVQEHGHRYDVIQAEQGNLPLTKAQLGFSGVLVTRSNGLAHFYEQYASEQARNKRATGQKSGSSTGNTLRRIGHVAAGGLQSVERSFDAADAIILINRDEHTYVAERLGHREKSYLVPNGLSESRFNEFDTYLSLPEERLAKQCVAFIGHWGERKGSSDFPQIVRLTRKFLPHTHFLFLGTGIASEVVLASFDAEDRAACKVVSRFQSCELPALLTEATIGILPSYIEGFGIGVLEQLALGLPTIAYDVPGPREMLRHFSEPMLIPPGNTEKAAERLIELLSLSSLDYTSLSLHARQISERFCWRDIALQMLDIYTEAADKSKKSVLQVAV